MKAVVWDAEEVDCGLLWRVMSSQSYFPHVFSMESNADSVKGLITKSTV